MIEEIEPKFQLKNLQQLFKQTSSILGLCRDSSKEKYANILVDEIQAIIETIKCLNEEVKKGNITIEMANIDIDYWTNENNWVEAKALYDILTCAENSSQCQRLRDTMELLQKSLGELNHSLLDAPVEYYQHFYDLCHEKEGTEKARVNFKKFKCKCMYKDDLLRSMLFFQQKIFYIFYEMDILRFDDCPLQEPHSRKFKFDFEQLCNEANETPATIKFCRCMNHYLIMPDKYTIHLNTAKLGKYLFEYYPKFTYDDFFAIAYLEESLNLYNQKMKEDGFLDAEPKDETGVNILKQPAAMVLWEKLQKAGYVNEHLKPLPDISNTQMSIIADEFCRFLMIKTKWTLFEDLWETKNLRTYYNKITYTDYFDDFRKNLKEILAA